MMLRDWEFDERPPMGLWSRAYVDDAVRGRAVTGRKVVNKAKAKRDEAMKEDRKAGMSLEQLAEKYKLSYGRVGLIVRDR